MRATRRTRGCLWRAFRSLQTLGLLRTTPAKLYILREVNLKPDWMCWQTVCCCVYRHGVYCGVESAVWRRMHQKRRRRNRVSNVLLCQPRDARTWRRCVHRLDNHPHEILTCIYGAHSCRESIRYSPATETIEPTILTQTNRTMLGSMYTQSSLGNRYNKFVDLSSISAASIASVALGVNQSINQSEFISDTGP